MTTTTLKLSPQQKRLWVWMESAESATSEVSLTLEGELDPIRLRESIAAVAGRHDALRTTFQYDAGETFPSQIISPGPEGSVLSATLVPESKTRNLLTLSLPALCADTATLNNLVCELRTLYETGGAVLPTAGSYADCCNAQKGDSGSGQATTAYPLALPFCRKAGRSTPFTPISLPVTLNSEVLKLSAGTDDLSHWLLAAWYVLLWRYSGQSEVTVACIVEGHGDDSLRTVLGRFARPVAVPVTLADALPFREVVDLVRAARARAEDLGTDDLEWDAVAGFAVDEKLPDAKSGGVSFSISRRRSFPDRFPVTLRVETDGASWNPELVFDPLCFSDDTMARMARSLATLLTAIAANPEMAAGELSILTDADRCRVVSAFNQTAAAHPAEKCIHELFQDQVEKTPDRTALRDLARSFNYRELNRRTNRIAHYLRKQGVGANTPVGLYIERSADMIIGLLAILKAGGCYLALAPGDPAARIAHQLTEAHAPVLLTERQRLAELPEYNGKIVLLDESFETESSENPETNTKPSDLIYVIYTSGSTGVPKGVATQHYNVVNYTHHICRQLGVNQDPEGWHFATVSTLCADLGNTSVFGALISGGCLHVIDYETAMSPKLFAGYIAEHPIDLLKIAPSQMAALINGADGRKVLPRQWVVMGGEKLSWQLVQQIRGSSDCQVMNHYGPTETTIGCCTLVVDESRFVEWQPATVPLGRPIANDEVYILDQHLQPVPIGVAGELCMAGGGLSRGYLNQPKLTGERFIRHPFSDDPSARLYRTGDLARFLPDGNIEFLGRMDQQVKIRGFRVEPAEIEAALRRYPGIAQAVVLAGEGAHGETTLAAYLVAAAALDAAALRLHLTSRIPEYMVPSRFAVVDAIPLTSNGKVDARALATLGGTPVGEVRNVAAPRDADEEKMAAIWMEVLDLDRIGINDNFFEVGGHSLLAMQIISQIRSRFGVQLPVRAFLMAPTVAESVLKVRECPQAPQEDEELARILEELEGLSEEEAGRLLLDNE